VFESKAIFKFKNPEPGTQDRFVIDRDDFKYFLEDYGITAEEVELLPFSEATVDELVEAIGSELESENYHSLTEVADKVHMGLKEEGYGEEDQRKIVIILGEVLLSAI